MRSSGGGKRRFPPRRATACGRPASATCGPLPETVIEATAADHGNLVVGGGAERQPQFREPRQPEVRGQLPLPSPPLVVAYALAGRVDIDLKTEPLGTCATAAGLPARCVADAKGSRGRDRPWVRSRFHKEYSARSSTATAPGRPAGAGGRPVPVGREIYLSVKHPPYCGHGPNTRRSVTKGARVLAVLGDSITTDHISRRPARSRRTGRRVRGLLLTASGRRISTVTVRAAATTSGGINVRRKTAGPKHGGRRDATCPTARRCPSSTPWRSTRRRACRW